MRKAIIVAALSFLSIAAMSQTLSYSFDMIRPDSFYLVETFVTKPTPENPRGNTTTSPMLFRDSSDVRAYLIQLGSESEKYKKEAERFSNASALVDFKADMILKLIASPAFVFEPKK